MNRKFLIPFFLILMTPLLWSSTGSSPWSSNRLSLTLAYYGETVTHPGIMVGVEYQVFEQSGHEVSAFLNLGNYLHYKNHIPVFINSGLGYRHTFDSGFNLNGSIGIGYFHKFLDGEIYQVVDGQVQKVPNSGRPAFMPLIDLGMGWDLEKQKGIPIDLYIKTQIFGEYSVNEMIIPHISLIFGVRKMIKENNSDQ